jgi:hypothetical protein
MVLEKQRQEGKLAKITASFTAHLRHKTLDKP